jgi:hypothetical protein
VKTKTNTRRKRNNGREQPFPPTTTNKQILGMPRQGTIIRQVQIEDQSRPKKAKVETKTQTKTNNKGPHRARDLDQELSQNQQKRNMTFGKDKPFHIIYYLYFIVYQKKRPLK